MNLILIREQKYQCARSNLYCSRPFYLKLVLEYCLFPSYLQLYTYLLSWCRPRCSSAPYKVTTFNTNNIQVFEHIILIPDHIAS